MEKVNLYLYSSVKGVKGSGIGIYILEAPDIESTDKRSNTLTKIVNVEGTRMRCLLTESKCALERFRRPANLHIFVDDEALHRVFISDLQKWHDNNWRTVRGTEVKNRDLLEDIYDMLKCHVYEVEYSKDHKYYSWQQFEAERRIHERTDKNGHRQPDSISQGTA